MVKTINIWMTIILIGAVLYFVGLPLLVASIMEERRNCHWEGSEQWCEVR